MVLRWLGYGALLLLCGLFFLFSPGYFSFFLLLCLLLLPLLSLLAALLGRRGLDLSLSTGAVEALQGDSVVLTLRAVSSHALLALPVFELEVTNLLHPQLEPILVRGAFPDNEPFLQPLPTACCGWVQYAVTRLYVEDWMGLFHLPLRRRWTGAVLVRPAPRRDGLPDLSDETVGAPLLPRPQGGPGEDYELRDYRPGDPVSAIHWKLTAKRPEENAPVLRETLEPLRRALLVSYDHFGPPEEVDRALARLTGLADRLLELERPFALRWVDPFTGAAEHFSILCAQDWARCFRQLCRRPAPLAPAVQTAPFTPGGDVRYLLLDGREQEAAP